MAPAIKEDEIFKTAPFDPRFPNTNQTRYCYQSYLDFHRCQKVRGSDYKPCEYFSKVFHSVCPNAWIEKWDGQREEGNFAGNI
ncbi:cytochrome c oxidase subunit 6B1 [Diabrotica virgifera virgifera]|uniref:Cytochrome c oxidase subunit n=1 Tax=Diabrotica virgifera virgifera TaxID=50390 RepID=A0A6P7GDB2_DIAVI|nr:cytochrome c oxidase subunit 6B1 [Diabrotica virgifera virgifera]XP_050506679.1 cytochrome c oxidase subunit 6B1 [Diabrotica virgifera virgifera]